jgi:alkylation response protein AidB-like acyl-CoA dehydrogenase
MLDPEALPELAAGFAALFAAGAGQHDRDGSFPAENLRALRDAGIFRLFLPRELGGFGADAAQAARFLRKISAGDASTALILTQHLAVTGAFSTRAGAQPRLARFLREQVAADAFTPLYTGAPEYEGRGPTSARRVEGGFVVNGRKGFATGNPIADWAVSQASWYEGPGGTHTVLFVYPFEQPAIEVVPTWDTLGMRATVSHDYLINDMFVPDADVIALGAEAAERPAPGADNVHSALVAYGNVCFGAVYLGIADAAKDFVVEAVTKRTPVKEIQPFASNPAVQSALGELDLSWREVAAMFDWTVAAHRKIDMSASGTLPDIVAMKDRVTHGAVRIVDACLTLAGGMAISKRSPLERYYRDVRAGPIHPVNHNAAVTMLGKRIVDDAG